MFCFSPDFHTQIVGIFHVSKHESTVSVSAKDYYLSWRYHSLLNQFPTSGYLPYCQSFSYHEQCWLMQILNYVSWCICSAVSWKHIPRNGGVRLSEPTHFPAEWLSLQHCLQEDWSVHFATLGVQLSPTAGIIFVLVFANLIGGKNTALLLRCAYLWFLGRPRIFSYTWGLFGFRLLRIAIVQSWQSPTGCLSFPPPSPPRSTGPAAPPECFLQDWSPRKEEFLPSDSSNQPTLGLAGHQSPDSQVPLSMSLRHRDLKSQICLKKKFLQTDPENTFQGWLLAGFEEPGQKKLLEHSFKVPCSREV